MQRDGCWLRSLRAVLAGVFVSSAVFADVIYVDANAGGAGGAGDGTSWADAYTDLQLALTAAVPGDEIWVAAGTYRPTASTDRAVSFVLREGVGIYGGFAGDETLREQRDPGAHVTTLSGDIGASPGNSDNSYHVVRAEAGLTASSILDGFTITGGRADGGEDDRFGGGMLVSGGSPTLTRLALTSNHAGTGGGLAIREGTPTLTDCSIVSNSGGGLWALSAFSCTGCVVRWNEGDGISYRGAPTLINTIVAENMGRGVVVNSLGGSLVNCTIAHNLGAGLYVYFPFPGPLNEPLAVSVRNTIIWGNTTGISGRVSGIVGVSYSDVQGSAVYPGIGNIWTDPLFLAPPGDLTPGPGSPATDAANNAAVPAGVTTDVAGLPRFRDDPEVSDTGVGTPPIVDMGAHETGLAVTAPQSLALCLGDDAEFSVNSGTLSLSYQWRKDEVPLTDGGRISGADTDTLTIADAIPGDAGVYDVVVTNSDGDSIDSANASLTVSALARNPEIAAPFALPSGAAGSASVPTDSGSSWTWSLTGGTITAGQGTSAITFAAGDAGTAMLLSVTDPSWGCPTSAASTTVAVDFLDVPAGDPFHDFVAAVSAGGITAGCGGGNYCRDAVVTRAQMAVFLLKAKHGAGYVPPPCEGTFVDVPCPSMFADWVEQLVRELISVTCGGGSFCASSPVLRQQMAVFLLRAALGPGYSPPPCTGVFEDVPCSIPYASWIEDLFRLGITGGCSVSPRLFCPISSVTRGQMAVFLTKAFDLPRP